MSWGYKQGKKTMDHHTYDRLCCFQIKINIIPTLGKVPPNKHRPSRAIGIVYAAKQVFSVKLNFTFQTLNLKLSERLVEC